MSGIIGGTGSRSRVLGRHAVADTAIIAGQIGSASVNAGDLTADTLIPFDEFWADQGGISYDSSSKKFTVPVVGIYRITLNPMITQQNSARIRIGINTTTPDSTSHRGTAYRGVGDYDTLCIDSTLLLQANDYIVFRLQQGQMYNLSNDRFTQFSIQLIG